MARATAGAKRSNASTCGPVCSCAVSDVTTSTPMRRSLAINGIVIAGSAGTWSLLCALSRRFSTKVGSSFAQAVRTELRSTGAMMPIICSQVPQAATHMRE